MIALTRTRDAHAVPPDFYGTRRIAHNLELLQAMLTGNGKLPDWKSEIWSKAKPQLLQESNGKCAYCESPTTVVAYGDVEHFRPKSKYWWLAYCYENYLPSCTLCNQRYKKDEFPLASTAKMMKAPDLKAGMNEAELNQLATIMTCDALSDTAGMSMKKFERAMQQEHALLIHPYFQNPEYYFAYQAIPATKEVLIVARRKSAASIVAACEKGFGINRQELRDERYRYYAMYVIYRQALESLPANNELLKQNIRSRIEEMKVGKLRYTGMIRYFETKKLSELATE
ncbi:MAG: hypothetical protein JST06_02140 [Bacteroidetes bacterium]|nr:hypothetical protein [Bacteroidota bacterium]MBS1630898.1 hypothetical protein [Bacteroidota bacterium]